ncbi:MAG: endolytic transglycosylase MltG [Actinomycetota bacterium]
MALTRRGRIIVALSILTLIVAAPVVAGTVYLHSIGFLGSSEPGKKVEVLVAKGASVNAIAEELERAGVIRSSFGFRLVTFVEAGAEDIQAGRYRLPQGLTARAALEALIDEGPLAEDFVVVTFPEGWWLDEFAARVAENTDILKGEFVKIATSGAVRSRFQPQGVDTLEGLLFPSTYQIGKKEDARGVIEKLVREFDRRMAAIDPSKGRAHGVSDYEAIIVASMVEAETFQDSERGMVARVIYNRLEAGMPLGIDATVLYALGERKNELTESDLEVDSPYNTREVTGLPPTPIGSPGSASLEAALNPADGDWLYYVLTDCEGHHSFSVDYDDFLADKATYQSLEC